MTVPQHPYALGHDLAEHGVGAVVDVEEADDEAVLVQIGTDHARADFHRGQVAIGRADAVDGEQRTRRQAPLLVD